MVHWFAKVEVMLAATLSNVSGLSLDMGKAILSGVRADSAKSLIIRALEQRKMKDDILHLKDVFDHLGVITSVRNDLLHYGQTQNSESGFAVVKMSHMREKDIIYSVTTNDLNDMSRDLFKIHSHLIHFEWHRVAPESQMIRDLEEWMSVPWRYKRRGPNAQMNKRKKAVPKGTRQRPPSKN